MKHLFILLTGSVLLSFSAQSQSLVQDSAVTEGGTKDVYYSLKNGVVKSEPAENWDLAFTSKLIDAAVLVNDVKGVSAWKISDNIADWNTIDTTGKLTTRLYNNDTSWAVGALANMGVSHPDYGWGTYNQVTRNLNGSRIFVLQLKDGSFRKFMIESMATNGTWTFKMANLDGTGEQTKTVNKNDYKNRNFIYYDITADQFVDREPAVADWDLVFSKYMSPINTGPGGIVYYPLTGALLNTNAQNAERRGVSVDSDDTSSLNWNAHFTEIGGDWKSFNRTTFQYEFEDSLAYFVRVASGEVFKIYFTNYVGGTSGKFEFFKKSIAGTASLKQIASSNLNVYPNPASSKINVSSEESGVMTLIGLHGQIISTQNMESGSTVAISVEDLPEGIYILSLQTEKGTVNKRFVIAH